MRKTILVLTAVLLFTLPSFAKTGINDPKELESFLDGIMAAHFKDHHIPGATLAVVKDGKIFFKKGYGYADIDKRIPVDPDKTLFRPGSVSKLFTWTSMMQMIEQGKLDLKADVNKYLTYFKIPDTYPKPVTVSDLLTHSAGFEDSGIRNWAKTYEKLPAIRDFLKKCLPARVRAPGKLAVYSNYGCTLGGYLVEVVSGIPFNKYAEQKIFKPLGMDNTTFDQKQTPHLIKNLAKGYDFNSGKYEESKFDFITVQPAGSSMSTASDMAKFMIAHMTADPRLMKASTYKEMHAPHFGFDPRLNRMCYGFYELKLNGRRLIGHEGDVGSFHSLLMFSPADNFGIFVSYNSLGGAHARRLLMQALMDHYYPSALPPVKAIDLGKQAGLLSGTYMTNRRPYTTFEKSVMLIGGAEKITVMKDNTVLFKEDRSYYAKEPLIFAPLYSRGISIFKEVDGRMYYTPDFPFLQYVKQAWHESQLFHQIVFGICILIFLASLIGWPVRSVMKREFSIAHLLSWTVCLIFTAAYPLVFNSIAETAFTEAAVVPYLMLILFGVVLTIGVVLVTLLAWINKYWTLWGRIRYTAVTVTMLVFIWWLNYWNLLGFKF